MDFQKGGQRGNVPFSSHSINRYNFSLLILIICLRQCVWLTRYKVILFSPFHRKSSLYSLILKIASCPCFVDIFLISLRVLMFVLKHFVVVLLVFVKYIFSQFFAFNISMPLCFRQYMFSHFFAFNISMSLCFRDVSYKQNILVSWIFYYPTVSFN